MVWWLSALAVALALIILIILVTGGFFWRRRSSAPARRMLVVIGIDGGERQVLDRLWEEGKLPHLRQIARRGVLGDPAHRL